VSIVVGATNFKLLVYTPAVFAIEIEVALLTAVEVKVATAEVVRSRDVPPRLKVKVADPAPVIFALMV